MEKRKPHYGLLSVQSAVRLRGADAFTATALVGARAMGLKMKCECPSCGQKDMIHCGKDVPYTYKGRSMVISDIKGWHCPHCNEVEFDAGEGVRFAESIEKFSDGIDAMEAAELARIRKKLKLTQQEASMLTGGGRNAFSRYERGRVKPMSAITNLFKLLDRHPDLLDELKSQVKDGGTVGRG